MKKSFVLFTLLSVHMLLSAQQKTSLRSIHSIGLLNGSKGAGLSLQSILGASLKNSFAGVGLGLDHYSFRSIPLFVDFRQELGRKKQRLFVYGDGGYNFDWLTERQANQQRQMFSSINFKGGMYYDAGLGYLVRFDNSNALVFSLGYCYKELKDKVPFTNCSIGACGVRTDTYTYHMPRVLIKAGWRF